MSPAAEPWSAKQAAEIIDKHKTIEGAALVILHALQNEFGYVPEPTIPMVAEALSLSRAEVHGVFTFYHDFRKEPAGRHVLKLCRAEACQSMGTDALCAHAQKKLGANFGETTRDGTFTVEAVYCLGNCALSPAVMIDEDLYGMVDAKRFDAIIDKVSKEGA